MQRYENFFGMANKVYVFHKKSRYYFTISLSELYYLCMTRKEIEKLFKMHYAQMYRLAVTILYDEDESKDVVSEVFARLMVRDITLQEDTAEAYLMMSVRNQCRNELERKQVRERFLRLLSDEAVEPTIAQSEGLRMRELMRYVREQLPPLSQQVFKLRFVKEMTCQEVADELGVSRQTVHTHLRQSVEKIRLFFNSNT